MYSNYTGKGLHCAWCHCFKANLVLTHVYDTQARLNTGNEIFSYLFYFSVEDLGEDRMFRISTRESEMCNSRSLVRLYIYFLLFVCF